jgi:putative addiction module CopG family antidote
MSIQLSPEAEARVKEFVDRGSYDDPAAVLDEALRVLEERDKLERLRALIAVAEEQAARGQVVEWTPDFLDRLKREAAENVRLGKPLRDEVIP